MSQLTNLHWLYPSEKQISHLAAVQAENVSGVEETLKSKLQTSYYHSPKPYLK